MNLRQYIALHTPYIVIVSPNVEARGMADADAETLSQLTTHKFEAGERYQMVENSQIVQIHKKRDVTGHDSINE